MIVTSGITMFVLALGPAMLNSSTLFIRVIAMVNDQKLPPWLLNYSCHTLQLLISLDPGLIKKQTFLILDRNPLVGLLLGK